MTPLQKIESEAMVWRKKYHDLDDKIGKLRDKIAHQCHLALKANSMPEEEVKKLGYEMEATNEQYDKMRTEYITARQVFYTLTEIQQSILKQ